MFQNKGTLLLFAAGMMAASGNLWSDNAPAASTPAAMPASQAAPKPAKADSPNVAAMKAANALEAAGNTEAAIAAYEKMGVLKSKKMEAWRLNNEALAYLMEDKADQAVPLLEKATAADDKNYVAWNNLGTAYEGTDQLDKAKDAYQKSIDTAKEAGASSAKAEGNLQALQPRLDKMNAKNGGAKGAGGDADSGASDAGGTTQK